jgi:hypothetical protein
MDLFQCLLQASESGLVVKLKSNNTELFFAYAIASILIKRPQLLAAFFMGCLLFEWSLFDHFSEAQLYLIGFLIYSYVIPCNVFTMRTKAACVIMCFLCLLFAYDAAFYGVNGFYGESETVIYNNIEYLFTCCHCLIIYTLINFKAIRNNIRIIVDSVCNMSRNSVLFVVL